MLTMWASDRSNRKLTRLLIEANVGILTRLRQSFALRRAGFG
jgi:hypothetical protein